MYAISNMHRHAPQERGQVILIALVFFGVFTSMTAAFVNLLTASEQAERVHIASTQALALAEAGIDTAIYELNQSASYTGETDTVLPPGTFNVSISTIDDSTKQITATGYVPNSANPITTETVRVQVGIDSSIISFRYGVQAGAGGFALSGGAEINGSAYANGTISATNGVHITGSAIAANPPALSADQANDTPVPITSCTSSTCITFADTTATQDIAQSFKLSTAVGMNTVQFYIKKVGAPSDATIRVVNNSAGSPGTDVLFTGTLSASAVTTSFGWVTVTMPSTPVLDPSETYWLIIDASSNASKYYILGSSAGGYTNGAAKIGRYGTSWSDTTPSGLDGYFRIYVGGGTSMLQQRLCRYPTVTSKSGKMTRAPGALLRAIITWAGPARLLDLRRLPAISLSMAAGH